MNYGILLDEELNNRRLADIFGVFLVMMFLCIFSENQTTKLPVREDMAGIHNISEGVAGNSGIIPEIDTGNNKKKKGIGIQIENRLCQMFLFSEVPEISTLRDPAMDEILTSGEDSTEDILPQPVMPAEDLSASVLQPVTVVEEPPVPVPEPAIVPEEVSEPVPDNQTSVSEIPEEVSGAVEETEQIIVCNGFLMDTAGKITGCQDVMLTDGVLCLPKDAGCTGIARGALDSLSPKVYEIYIPANITSIEDGAFDNLTELIFIQVHPDNLVYESSDGILCKK